MLWTTEVPIFVFALSTIAVEVGVAVGGDAVATIDEVTLCNRQSIVRSRGRRRKAIRRLSQVVFFFGWNRFRR